MDENVDYSNVRKREASKPRGVNDKAQFNSTTMTATK